MCCSHEQSVGCITIMAEEKVPVPPAIGFHMPDGGLDGRSSLEFAAHGRCEAALLACNDDGGRSVVIVAAIALVDIDALRADAADIDGLADGLIKGMAVIRVRLEGNGGQHQSFPVRCRNPDLGPKLVRRACLALGDAHNLGRMQRIELVPAFGFWASRGPARPRRRANRLSSSAFPAILR